MKIGIIASVATCALFIITWIAIRRPALDEQRTESAQIHVVPAIFPSTVEKAHRNTIANNLQKNVENTLPASRDFEHRLRESFFSAPDVTNLIHISCGKIECDVFATGGDKPSYPKAAALIIAMNSGIIDDRLSKIGLKAKIQNNFQPRDDGKLHLELLII